MDLSGTEVWKWIYLVQKYGNGSGTEVWEWIWYRSMGRDLEQSNGKGSGTEL